MPISRALRTLYFARSTGFPPNRNVPPSGRPAPDEQADERGLARAVIAKQCHDLTFRHVQIGVPQRRHRSERFPYPSYTEQHSHNASMSL